jgi:2-polyprenyl-3-methyl-5-hydroxy-6-metoxy-1,4-benzoquinol methylase
MIANREYRTKLYENYATTQKPEWSEPDSRLDAISIDAALARMRGWLPSNPGAKCLDLGCGSGLLLEALRKTGFSDLRGVDLGGQTVEIARKKGFEVAQGDLRD